MEPTAQQPAAPQQPAPQTTSKGFAIAALVLSILSIVLSIFWPLAALLAMAALVFAIISLVKKFGGKGMSIASLVMGGVSLFILVPFWIIISIVMYGGFLNYAQTYAPQHQSPYSDSYSDPQLEQDPSSSSSDPRQLFN